VQAQEKLAALFTIAKGEVESERFSFLIRHSKQHVDVMAKFCSPDFDFDPRNVPRWSPRDLA
jgi:hypothetical protein